MKARLLIVDDDPSILDSLEERFTARGFDVRTATSGKEALTRAEAGVDVMLLDLQLPEGDGVWVLEKLREASIDATVIVITAHGTIDRAVAAMKAGAYDFVEKPFDAARLEESVGRAVERSTLLRTNSALKSSATNPQFIHGDPKMELLVGQAQRAATSSSTVLVLGESGTGKEVLARAIHDWSPRQEGPFVAVNCAALSETLLESELFGHEQGAFTGARSRHKGKIEASHGGTLFLDEIGDTTPGFQKRLLRVLQEHRFQRVGGNQTIDVDLRCLAATNKNLKALVDSGEFREDLFYRLNVIALELPPLRERPGDIENLARTFVETISEQVGRPGLQLDAEAMRALASYTWPGNIRELRNVIERAAVLAETRTLGVEDLPPEFSMGSSPRTAQGETDRATGFHDRVEAFRSSVLLEALEAHDGHQTKAAESLGLQRSYFARLLKKYGLTGA